MIRFNGKYLVSGLLFAVATMGLLAHPAMAATFTWNGAGVSSGTGNTDWNTAANWIVTGTDVDGVPDADDNVDITFDQNFDDGNAGTEDFAVVVPNGATAGRVVIDGYGGAGRRVQIGQNAGDVVTWGKSQAVDVNVSNESWRILTGVTLDLIDAGTISDPTWTMGRSTSSNIDGTLQLTNGGTIYIDNDLNSSPNFQGGIRFTNASSTIEFDTGTQLMNAGSGSVEFLGSQTITGLSLLSLNSGTLASGDSSPLNNFGSVRIRKDSNDNRNGSAQFAAGTYRAIIVSDRVGQTAAGSPSLRADGDVVFVGDSGLSTPGGDGSIEVIMQDNRSDVGTFDLRGHDLTVTSTAPVILGSSTANNTGLLQLSNPAGSGTDGTTADIASNIIIHPNGEIRGDAETIIQLAGHFQNASTHNTNFNLESSTLVMDGSGTEFSPQLLEVQGLDIGENPAGLIDNFGIADLVIGTTIASTYVQLSDAFDFQNDALADALYLSGSTLIVNAGSTLDLNGLNLYEGGQRVQAGPSNLPFVTANGGFIIDSTLPPVPEPTTMALLSLGALIILPRRRCEARRSPGHSCVRSSAPVRGRGRPLET